MGKFGSFLPYPVRVFLLFLLGALPVLAYGVYRQDQADWEAVNRAQLEAEMAEQRVLETSRIDYTAQPHSLSLGDGQVLSVKSLLNVDYEMRFGSFVWDDEGIPEGPVQIRVDLAGQTLSVFRAGHEIGSAVIVYGSDSKPTPIGSFPVMEKDADYHSRTYDAPMPYMLRLTMDGVAIHGSNVRRGWATHGCVGVPLEFARLLFEEVKNGDVVTILPMAQDHPKT